MHFLVPPLAMIVEDDRLQCDSLAGVLQRQNMDVIHCTSAAAAELLVARIGPELRLLVTDLWLSDSPAGADIARYAKERHPQLGVIVISGDEQTDLPASIRFLRKPYQPADLVRVAVGMI